MRSVWPIGEWGIVKFQGWYWKDGLKEDIKGKE